MLSNWVHNENLRSLLMNNLNDMSAAAALYGDNQNNENAYDALEEYERVARKPGGPLRLRWGRSTGGKVPAAENNEQKAKKVS